MSSKTPVKSPVISDVFSILINILGNTFPCLAKQSLKLTPLFKSKTIFRYNIAIFFFLLCLLNISMESSNGIPDFT